MNKNLIRFSESLLGTAIFFVQKKDDFLCLLANYWSLNALTIKNCQPFLSSVNYQISQAVLASSKNRFTGWLQPSTCFKQRHTQNRVQNKIRHLKECSYEFWHDIRSINICNTHEFSILAAHWEVSGHLLRQYYFLQQVKSSTQIGPQKCSQYFT